MRDRGSRRPTTKQSGPGRTEAACYKPELRTLLVRANGTPPSPSRARFRGVVLIDNFVRRGLGRGPLVHLLCSTVETDFLSPMPWKWPCGCHPASCCRFMISAPRLWHC